MVATAFFDFAVEVLEGDVLAAVDARRLFAEIRVERQMLDLHLLQIVRVVRLERGAVQAAAAVVVSAQLFVLLPLDPAVQFEQLHVHRVFLDDGRLFCWSGRL